MYTALLGESMPKIVLPIQFFNGNLEEMKVDMQKQTDIDFGGEKM
jgi:hypothetical protein